ncbi:MAG TPA: TadE family protein [Gaiellaceae bacterium]|jgi:Flp pilus assembly pilin Flp
MTERAPTPTAAANSLPVRGPSRRLLRRLRQSERGTAVVEFALVAPLLFLLVLGVLDFARLLAYYNTLTQIASQGARAAAVDRNPDGTAISSPSSLQLQLKDNYTGAPEVKDSSTYRVCITKLPASVGDVVTVQASFTFNFIPFIGRDIGALTKPLRAVSTERAEVFPVDYGQVDQAGNGC